MMASQICKTANKASQKCVPIANVPSTVFLTCYTFVQNYNHHSVHEKIQAVVLCRSVRMKEFLTQMQYWFYNTIRSYTFLITFYVKLLQYNKTDVRDSMGHSVWYIL